MGKEETPQKMRVVYRLEHRLAGLELHAGLVIIAHLERFTTVYHALQRTAPFGLPSTGDEVQERGFSGGVAPHDAHALIALEIVSKVLQIAFLLPPETHVPAIDHLVAQVGTLHLGFAQVYLLLDIAVVGPFLDVPEGLLAVLGLSGTGAGALVHPFQFPAVEVSHPFRLRVVIVYALLALFQKVHVVPAVDEDLPAVHFHDGVAYAVQEIAVVRYHEQGTATVFQAPFQELDGVYVQVVGGLVHDVEIGLGGQHLRKGHALDFPAGKVFHEPLRHQAELVQQLRHPELVLPQVVLVQLLRPLGRLVHDLPKEGFLRVKAVFLLQKSNTDVFEKQDLPTAVRRVFPRQDAQERSFSRPVGRDERHFVPFIDIEADVLEQHLRPITLGDILYLQVTGHGIYCCITPLPSISSPSYHTANWPGEIPR